MIGSLLYAALVSRIDISFAVAKISRKVDNPTERDWKSAKHIIRYLKDKQTFCLKYSKQANIGMTAYTDADFAGDEATSGWLIMFGGGPVAWRSQRQRLVTLSSTEAEFVALCSTVKEVICLRALALESSIINRQPIKVLCDNQSAIFIAKEDSAVHRARHLGAQIRYLREQSIKGEVSIGHVASVYQLADILTKSTSKEIFYKHRSKLMQDI